MGLLKWMAGLGLVAAVGIGAGVYFAFFGAGPQITYVTPDLVPIDLNTAAPSDQPPVTLPAAVILPVPFTPQAPLGNWAAKQHTCEEASMVMVDRYLHGDHSGGLIDPGTADASISQITSWKPALDLTPLQIGQPAQKYMGWAYKVLPSDRLSMKQQLALGRPLIVGVRTHGLGNPNYPGYRTHFEQVGWSVSHYLVVVGYDAADKGPGVPHHLRPADARHRRPRPGLSVTQQRPDLPGPRPAGDELAPTALTSTRSPL